MKSGATLEAIRAEQARQDRALRRIERTLSQLGTRREIERLAAEEEAERRLREPERLRHLHRSEALLRRHLPC